MKRFILEQSNDELYTSHSELVLAGLCINWFSDLSGVVGRKMKQCANVISHTDLIRNYLSLLCLGKSDYEAIGSKRKDVHFKSSLGIKNVPSTERLQQRLEETAHRYAEVANKCSINLLKNEK